MTNWTRTKQEPTATHILRRMWSWFRHTLRKPINNITRRALTWNAQENIWCKVLRPKSRADAPVWILGEDRRGVCWRSVVSGL